MLQDLQCSLLTHGIPTAIAEQNAIPGITNKILGYFADKIFVTYSQTQTFFPQTKVVVSGNPVRAVLTAKRHEGKGKKIIDSCWFSADRRVLKQLITASLICCLDCRV